MTDAARRSSAALIPQPPVWLVGRDANTAFLERAARLAGMEMVGPLDLVDPRLRSIPGTVRLVVCNSLAALDDARAWLRPLLDRDPALGRRTLLMSGYDPQHFGPFFEETGVRLLKKPFSFEESVMALTRLGAPSSGTT
jgi:hypothetical protein